MKEIICYEKYQVHCTTNARVQQQINLMESIRSDQVHIKALCMFQVLFVFECLKNFYML